MSHRTENTPSDNTFRPVDGQAVRALTGRHAQQIGHVVGEPTSDGWYLVLFGEDLQRGPFGRYPANELAPVRRDDMPPSPEVEVVKHLTGVDPTVEPEPSNIDEWHCDVEGCDFHIMAAGPVDIDDEDPFQLEIDAHRRGHETDPRDAVRGVVGEVPALPIWVALREVGTVYDALVALRDLPAADVARALRSVADVLDGGAR